MWFRFFVRVLTVLFLWAALIRYEGLESGYTLTILSPLELEAETDWLHVKGTAWFNCYAISADKWLCKFFNG